METTTTDRRTDVLKASPRMFESDLLDKLSRVHPSVPVIIFLPAILVLLGLGIARMDAPPLIGLFAGGFLAGYLIYDMTHYHLHHHKPKTWIGRRLRELHMRHHFQDDTTGFGISAPYWDRFFGTFSRLAEREKTATDAR